MNLEAVNSALAVTVRKQEEEIKVMRAALEEITSLGAQKRGSVSYAMAAIARAALEAPQERIDTAQPTAPGGDA